MEGHLMTHTWVISLLGQMINYESFQVHIWVMTHTVRMTSWFKWLLSTAYESYESSQFQRGADGGGGLHEKAAEVLYAFLIEHTLISAEFFFVMWRFVGRRFVYDVSKNCLCETGNWPMCVLSTEVPRGLIKMSWRCPIPRGEDGITMAD